MNNILFYALGFTLLVLVKSDHPLSWYRDLEDVNIDGTSYPKSSDTAYRLPTNVVPLEYDIHIDLYFSERTDRPFSYDGRENIIIEAVESNVTQIVLHANVDRINVISVIDDNGRPVRLNSMLPFETVAMYHFLKINLAESLIVGTKYNLYIDYSSTMNDGPMKRGIWKGWYTDDNGNERIYATTHFQPYNARQAFPCWDEPLFKSVFKLHLSRPASYSATFSNTKLENSTILTNNRVRDDFLETPKMSSYLVTFLVSETFQSIAEDTSFDPPIRIIGRSNTVGLANHALKLAVKMTEFFDDYFRIPYSSLHPNLLNDHISSPDWASAGTENWGMVSYRELYLIIDRNETIMTIEHYAATLVSHELAHKWFGNLITCYWWSNTWINEGYASYFGYIATHQMFPEYELHEHFNSRYLQTTLAFDSGVSTVPLNHDVNTPSEVTGHFGTISYSKAASFLRMTANIISLETFRKSCTLFLEKNAYEPTDQYDLLEAFTEAIQEDNSLAAYENFSFAEYYRIWVNEPGYPLLNVVINHSTGQMTLTQERFFLSASAEPTGQTYPIPITYSTSKNPNFNNLRPIYMMTLATDTLQKDAGEEWVIFNNLQEGHYRVNYDDRTWTLIAEALYNTPEAIHFLNRAQIADDVFAFMRSGKITYSFGFDILKFLEKETTFQVWDSAISGYTWLRNRLRHLPSKQAVFDEYILNQMEHAITTLGFEEVPGETPTTSIARQNILQFACTLGHAKCIEESWARYVDWRDNNKPVNSRVRRNVYMTAMREGGPNDFQFLLNHLTRSNFANDQLEVLRGMGASRDPELLTRYLSLTLTKNVRSHDKLNSFNYALLGNQENAATVLEFVKNNIDRIREEYVEDSPASPVHSALVNLAAYLDESQLVDGFARPASLHVGVRDADPEPLTRTRRDAAHDYEPLLGSKPWSGEFLTLYYQNWLETTQTSIPQYANAISGINSARNNMAWGTANADIILEATGSNAATAVLSKTILITVALLSIFV